MAMKQQQRSDRRNSYGQQPVQHVRRWISIQQRLLLLRIANSLIVISCYVMMMIVAVEVEGLVVQETRATILSPTSLVQLTNNNHNGNGYTHQTAQYGGFEPCPFRFSTQNCNVQANLYYVDTTLCDDSAVRQTVTSLTLQLQQQQQQQPSSSSLPEPQPQPFLLMVNRGECSFVRKVVQAQKLLVLSTTTNALAVGHEIAGLVIADTSCWCSSGNYCVSNSNNEVCQAEPPPMVAPTQEEEEENGSYTATTATIYLPSILLQKQDADAIKRVVLVSQLQPQPPDDNAAVVRMELSWNHDNNNDDNIAAAPAVVVQRPAVTVDFWHVPSPYRQRLYHNGDIPPSLGLALRGVGGGGIGEQPLQQPIVQPVLFTPKFYIRSGTEIGCRLPTADDNNNLRQQQQPLVQQGDSDYYGLFCEERCTNGGRYCVAEDPEQAFGEGVSGANLVEESLRRMCLWELHGSNDTDTNNNSNDPWWRYLSAFYERCTIDYNYDYEEGPLSYNDLLWNDTCSRLAMTDAGVDYMEVSRCVVSSGGVTEDKENTLLEASLRERTQLLLLLLQEEEEGAGAGANSFLRSPRPPTLIVNSVPFSGQFFSESLGAICASFTTDQVPDACRACASCTDHEYACLLNGGRCSDFDSDASLPPTSDGGVVVVPTVAPVFPQQPSSNNNNNDDGLPTTDQTGPGPGPNPTTTGGGGDVPNDNESSGQPDDGGSSPTTTTVSPPSSDTDEEDAVDAADNNNTNGDSSSGLSDNTKLVIVVAVVGGAIVVIFVFVMVLVCKLLKRIRKLEKGKGKQTPTTTSPAGSGVWNLPLYVTGVEDPFNNNSSSEFEQLPDDGGGVVEPVPNGNVGGGGGGGGGIGEPAAALCERIEVVVPPLPPPAVGVAAASDVKPAAEDVHEGSAAAPNNGASTTTTEAQSNSVPHVGDADIKLGEETPIIVLEEKPKEKDVNTAQEKVDSGPSITTNNEVVKDEEKARNKSLASAEIPKAKPKKSKYDASLLDIMGKAAPEPKIPRSFSCDGEEKEEISYD